MENKALYDMVVIGGGINGTGIAADAQGRGLSVFLCEKNDLASGTSSASSKLIHGGLRYLEHYDFGLVRESLHERKILAAMAPHLIKPMRFVVPFKKIRHPFWMIRLGLFYYDFMGLNATFKRSKAIHFDHYDPINPLKPQFNKGFIYSDAAVDDARLVIANALRSSQHGGTIQTRTACVDAKREGKYWLVRLRQEISQIEYSIQAKALINASGPWADQIVSDIVQCSSQYRLRLVKGSHIVIPKCHSRQEAYLLQHHDGRVIFVIPYLEHFTLIGTTDVPFDGDPNTAFISPEEVKYLCQIVNDYFQHPIKPHHVLHAWSGVRALVDSQSQHPIAAISREYKLELKTDRHQQLPLVNVFGGKLTTYRALAEKTLQILKPFFPQMKGSWTTHTPLPGGDLPQQSINVLIKQLQRNFPELPSHLLSRYAHSYGTLTYKILQTAKEISDLGQHFGHGLYEKEIRYLINHEWAQTIDDILLRRTKLGYFLSDNEKENLEEWMKNHSFKCLTAGTNRAHR